MATFSVANFLSEVNNRGLARADRFEVVITAPPCCRGATKFLLAGDRLVSLFCDQASLPQSRIRTSQQQIFGPPSFHPQSAEYGGDNFSLQFFLDADMTIKNFFDTWVDGIVNRSTGEVYFQDNYLCQGLTVTQLNQANTPVYRIKFEDLFPIAVNPVQLDYSMGSVNKLNVTFSYRRWYPVSIEPAAVPPATKTKAPPTNNKQPPKKKNTPVQTDYDIGNPMGDVSGYGGGW
jgi:hypothetical protein